MQIHNNPYVENLVEMGYDRADCETVSVAGVDKTFPMTIHGRVYQTQEEYDEALHDFINGLWATNYVGRNSRHAWWNLRH